MTALTEVFVTVKPDVDKFGPEVKKKLAAIDARKEGQQVASRFGVGLNGAIGSIVSKSAGIFVAGFAAIKGAQVFGGFIKDAAESARVSRLTAAAIKSTGGAAKLTANQVGDLATAISNKTGADDETIQSGANLLLTFTNVRNEVGKGNDIFNQAAATVTDMAAALNGGEVSANGVKAASIQLGKALNNPIKGVTALQKVGVSFTDKQKEQIKTLVESGKTMEAQKVILGELQKEFGGAAAAAGDPFTRLQTIFGNLGEELGGYLLPYAEKFATFVSDTLIPGVSGLVSILAKGDVTSAFTKAFGVEEDSGFVAFLLKVHDIASKVFTELKGGIIAFGSAWKANDGDITSSGFPGFMERVANAAHQAFDYFKAEVLPRLRDFAAFVVGNVVPAIRNLVGAVKPLATDVGAAVVAAFQKLGPILQSVGKYIAGTIVPAVVDFTRWLKENSTVVGAVAVGIGAIVGAIQIYKGTLAVVSAATKAYTAVQAALNFVMALNPIGIVVLALVGLAAGLVYAYKKSETFRDIVNGVFTAVKETAVTVFNAVIGFVKGAIDWIKSNWPLLLGILTGPIGTAVVLIARNWTAIKTAARDALKFIVDKVLDFGETIIRGASKAFGWVPGLGDKLKGAATEFGKFRDSVNAKLAGIQDQQINFTIKYSSSGVNLSAPSSVGRRAGGGPGGPVSGPGTTTSDTAGVYALSNKEWVIRAASSMKYGDRAMASINAGTATVIPDGGFAAGGRPGLNPALVADSSGLARSVTAVVSAAAKSAARQLAKSGGGLLGTMAFGRSQAGKPYVWGGVGPGGYDCSGFVSALINYARGRSPYRRLGSTESMPWGEMTGGTGRFMVGWFKGNPGHTAATINGVNFESRGGRGVVVGAGARGAYDGLFTNHAKVKGFAKGGRVEGDLPFDLVDPRGKNFQGKRFLKSLGIDDFDTGGRWKSGTLGVNLSGKTETVVAGGDTMTVRLSDDDRRLLEGLRDIPLVLNDRRVDEAFTRAAVRGGY